MCVNIYIFIENTQKTDETEDAITDLKTATTEWKRNRTEARQYRHIHTQTGKHTNIQKWTKNLLLKKKLNIFFHCCASFIVHNFSSFDNVFISLWILFGCRLFWIILFILFFSSLIVFAFYLNFEFFFCFGFFPDAHYIYTNEDE